LTSLQIIRDNFIANYKHDGETAPSADEMKETITQDISINEFYRLLQVIHGKANLDPLITGFANLIYNFIECRYTYLPDSVIEITFFEETLIFFWRFLHGNPHLLEELVQNQEALHKILSGILYCFDMNKKDPLKSNTIYICVFILLTLSSSRDFSLSLNEVFALKLKFDIPEYTQTTFGNLLIQIIQRSI
jgi:hypothetical protein